jgi:hypothetical protein
MRTVLPKVGQQQAKDLQLMRKRSKGSHNAGFVHPANISMILVL